MSCGSGGHVSWLSLPTRAEGVLGLGGDDNQRSWVGWGAVEGEFLLGNSRVISRLPLVTVAFLPQLCCAQETSAAHTHNFEGGKEECCPPVYILPGGGGKSKHFTEDPLSFQHPQSRGLNVQKYRGPNAQRTHGLGCILISSRMPRWSTWGSSMNEYRHSNIGYLKVRHISSRCLFIAFHRYVFCHLCFSHWA